MSSELPDPVDPVTPLAALSASGDRSTNPQQRRLSSSDNCGGQHDAAVDAWDMVVSCIRNLHHLLIAKFLACDIHWVVDVLTILVPSIHWAVLDESEEYTFALCMVRKVWFVVLWGIFFTLVKVLSLHAREWYLPSLPGYCYTCLFHIGVRQSVALEIGAYPTWGDISQDKRLRADGRYRGTRNFRHYHVEESVEGMDIEDLAAKLVGQTIGEDVEMPYVSILARTNQAIRVVCWIVVLACVPQQFWLFSAIILYIGFKLGYDKYALLLVVAIFTGFSVGLMSILIALAAMWVGANAVEVVGYRQLRRHWDRPEFAIPGIEDYPGGRPASGREHVFDLHNRNANYMGLEFIDDGYLRGEDRTEFLEQAGIVVTKTMHSGNTHKLAAMARRYFMWDSPRMDGWTGAKYMINIGGTFRGWPCYSSGLSFQPRISDSDCANLANYPTREGYGQMVVDDWIATNSAPVGSVEEDFKPEWKVCGLGGAVFWMAHCYDIPIKAFLACLYLNNSERGYVVVHAAPATFSDTNGVLPWTGQEWQHLPNGRTRWTWKGTSGREFDHSTRVLYEHLFTDYVQVSKGTWFVSDLFRTVLDVHLVRWSRTNVKPSRTSTRCLAVKFPRDHTDLVAIDPGANEVLPKLRRIGSTIQFDEQVRCAKDCDKLMINTRALNDNYWRNRGLNKPFLDHTECCSLWQAEGLRRQLIGYVESAESAGWLDWSILGLSADRRFAKKLSLEALSLLKRQPDRMITCPTLVQDEPYVNGCVQQPLCGPREFGMVGHRVNGQTIPQSVLDEHGPYYTIGLRGFGTSISAQMCHVLFGMTAVVPAILPLGRPENGGSALVASGNRLLATEIEYLIEELGVLIVVRTTDWCKWFGKIIPAERQPIIFVDMKKGCAYRVHYTTKTAAERAVQSFGATWADVADNTGWLSNVGGDERRYIAAPNGQIAFEMEADRQMTDSIKRHPKDAENWIQWKEESQFIELNIVAGSLHYQIPLLGQPKFGMLYDGEHGLETGYPAPHHFAHGSIANMRKLRQIDD